MSTKKCRCTAHFVPLMTKPSALRTIEHEMLVASDDATAGSAEPPSARGANANGKKRRDIHGYNEYQS